MRSQLAISIVDKAELPGNVQDMRWRQPSSMLAPKFLTQSQDARWTLRLVIAELNGSVVGVMPLRRCRMPAFPFALLDPVQTAPELFGTQPRSAESYLLVGGSPGLASGGATAETLDDEAATVVLAAMAQAGFAEAAAQGLTGAAMNVRSEQVEAFAGKEHSRCAVQTDTYASLAVADADAYLARLNQKKRATVRRDWKKLAELGLRAVELSPEEIVDEAAPLVVAVKQRHDIADTPQLAAMRLKMWARVDVGKRLAFVVRDRDGSLLAACFARHYGNVLETNDIGLHEDSPSRRLAYAEALFYGPMRYAIRTGCHTIELGQGSPEPKDIRGAKLLPVWAVGEHTKE